MAAAEAPPAKPMKFYLAATNIKFTQPAKPEDTLILRAQIDKHFGMLFRFNVEATTGRHLIASGTLTLAMVSGSE
jgi:acyl-CoA thioesterase FadM